MFSFSEVIGVGAQCAGDNDDVERTATPIQTATPDRLAELVHHLSDAPLHEARRAIRHTHKTCNDHDPLSVVAAALVQLRRNERQCASV